MYQLTPADVHRRLARSLGRLCLAIERRRIRRDVLADVIREFREAADSLEKMLGPPKTTRPPR